MSGCSGESCSSCSSCSSESGSGNDRLPPGMLRRYDLDVSAADGTLVWVEVENTPDGPLPSAASLELVSEAASSVEGRVFAVIFGGVDLKSAYAAMFSAGADTVYHVRGADVYRPEVYAEALCSVTERVVPALVLFPATPRGREVAPRYASVMGAGLTADCTGLAADGRRVVMTRPAFGGTMMADIECIGFPQVATVRPGTFLVREVRPGSSGTVIYWQCPDVIQKEVISEQASEDEGADIRDARILISLGNGIRDRSVVDLAYSVAEAMGAQVSCSRPLVERGWMPASRQVGLSGRTVAPDLYIAFGISGSVQHRAGMSRAKKVIAVNSDPDAPIHAYADISIGADAGEVLIEMARSLDLL